MVQHHPALLGQQTTSNTVFDEQHAIVAYNGKPFPGTQQTMRHFICIDSRDTLAVNAAKIPARWVALSDFPGIT